MPRNYTTFLASQNLKKDSEEVKIEQPVEIKLKKKTTKKVEEQVETGDTWEEKQESSEN